MKKATGKRGRDTDPRGYSWEFLVGVCRPVLQILTLFQAIEMSFSTPVFRPGLLAEIISSLFRLERNQKFLQLHLEFAYFSFFCSFGIKTINTFIHSRSSLENHTWYQTKIGKIYTRFQTKTAQKPYSFLLGRQIPTVYGLYKGVPPGTEFDRKNWTK